MITALSVLFFSLWGFSAPKAVEPDNVPASAKVLLVIRPDTVVNCDTTSRVKRMDRHVREQDVLDLFPESAEMRSEKKINVDRGNFADYAFHDHLAQQPNTPIETSILLNDMQPAGRLRQLYQLSCIFHGESQRFFFEYMEAGPQRGR